MISMALPNVMVLRIRLADENCRRWSKMLTAADGVLSLVNPSSESR